MTLNKRSVPALIVLILFIGLGTAFFIYKSNDHTECGNVIQLGLAEDGERVKETAHICRESYSF